MKCNIFVICNRDIIYFVQCNNVPFALLLSTPSCIVFFSVYINCFVSLIIVENKLCAWCG